MIPIRNLYFLLTYAWDVLEQSKAVNVGAEQLETPEDLFAKLVKEGVQHLIHRGLDRAYNLRGDEIAGIRGKLNVSETVKRLSLLRGRSCSEFDEYSYNTTHNQIVKATLRHLIHAPSLNRELREALLRLVGYFSDVDDVTLSSNLFRRVQLHSNNRFYLLLLNVCWVLYCHLLPIPGGRSLRFVEFTDDQLETVFEQFIRNYLKRCCKEFEVKRERFPWQDLLANRAAAAVLPTLETDVSLVSTDRKLIIEAKFYSKTLVTRHRADTSAIRAAHLYQLVSYLSNLQRRDQRPVEGILLYPRVDADLLFDYQLLGHKVRVATLDLTVEQPEEIGRQLSRLTSTPITPCTDRASIH